MEPKIWDWTAHTKSILIHCGYIAYHHGKIIKDTLISFVNAKFSTCKGNKHFIFLIPVETFQKEGNKRTLSANLNTKSVLKSRRFEF